MSGKTHFTYGMAVSIACCVQFGIESPEVFIPSCLIGALLPDIDRTGSTIGKLFPGMARMLYKKLGHRGLLHCPLVVYSCSRDNQMREFRNQSIFPNGNAFGHLFPFVFGFV